MHTVNILEAKTYLSSLIEKAAAGEPFVIAKAGKPMVKVSAWTGAEAPAPSRLGFMAGEYAIPDGFNRLGAEEIENAFDGSS